VDVVRGACTDRVRDFELAGPLPLDWRRHYDSSRNGQRMALGWGHTHSFDRVLRFDADGLSYVGPLGESTGFPALLNDGDNASADGFVLERISARIFQLHRPHGPYAEFRFRDVTRAAPLARLWTVAGVIRFEHGEDGKLEV